jgi:hypothetical protein
MGWNDCFGGAGVGWEQPGRSRPGCRRQEILSSPTQKSCRGEVPCSTVPAANPSPHDPYDKLSDHFRFAAQQLAKYRDSLKRTVDRAPAEECRQSVQHAAKIWNQVRATGKAAMTDHGGAWEAIARRDWQWAVRIDVGEVRRLLPGSQQCVAPEEVDPKLDGDCVPEGPAPALKRRSRRSGNPNSGPKSRRPAVRTGSSPRPPKRRRDSFSGAGGQRAVPYRPSNARSSRLTTDGGSG